MKAESLLIRTIELKDRNGRVVGSKEVVTYQGLLSKAHEEGLRSIKTTLVQAPSKENGQLAISHAEVETRRGTYQGFGDAYPGNVNPFIVPHLIRMAETRAKARALRDAVNIGVVSFEELDGEPSALEPFGPGSGASTAPRVAQPRASSPPQGSTEPASAPTNGAVTPMTESQRRYLFRLLAGRGLQGEAAHDYLLGQLKVDSLAKVSRIAATKLIDELAGSATGGNGRGPALQR
jgi:hypothetical protein